MDGSNNNFDGGGAVLPPTAEDYKRMWEQQSKQLKPNEYERQRQENLARARKEVFQEQVKKAVEVRDKRLETTFFDNINIQERR